MEETFLDQDTKDFVQLWDHVQGMRRYESIFSEKDELLLEELVANQNFSIALSLLQHRLRPHKLPEKIAHLARPQSCATVKPLPPNTVEPTLEQFRESIVASVASVPISRPPMQVPTREMLGLPLSGLKTIPVEAQGPEGKGRPAASPFSERRALVDEQNRAYNEGLLQDAAKQTDELKGYTSTSSFALVSPKLMAVDEGKGIKVVAMISSLGKRLEHTFHEDEQLFSVCQWASYQVEAELWDVSTNFPRQEWPLESRLRDLPIDRKRLLLFL